MVAHRTFDIARYGIPACYDIQPKQEFDADFYLEKADGDFDKFVSLLRDDGFVLSDVSKRVDLSNL